METHGYSIHRDITGGGARAAVFGVSDGLLSNIALILGVAGAHPAQRYIVLAGLAGLIAGAFSMAVGEFVSMRAQRELLERELLIEAREIRESPEAETTELARVYESRGVPRELAQEVARHLMQNPEIALEIHAREELGVAPDSLGSAWQASTASFASFAVGAFIPLVAWFFLHGLAAITTSITLSAIAAILVGGVVARLSERPFVRGALRQVVLFAIASGVTFEVGRILGSVLH
ncbi:MAG: VIT1/CCC1 transporter family protein [Ferrimicrobium sp.]